MKKILPDNASISYSRQAGPQFRDRLVAYDLPYGVTSVAYIVLVDVPSATITWRQLQYYKYYTDYLAKSLAFIPVYNDGHNFIYQRLFDIIPEPILPEYSALIRAWDSD